MSVNDGLALNQIRDKLACLERAKVFAPRIDEVIDYLEASGNLVDLIHPITRELRSVLGEGPEISLELYRDPEFDDKYLTIYIRQSEYTDKFLDRIDNVLSQFLGELAETPGYLLVTTDFKPPQY